MASMKIKAWSGKDLFKKKESGCGDKILYFSADLVANPR